METKKLIQRGKSIRNKNIVNEKLVEMLLM